MSIWQAVGPELALVESVTGWRAAADAVAPFVASELQELNTLMPHEGGGPFPGRVGVLMAGEYEITFDLSHFALPQLDTERWTADWLIDPVLYVLVDDMEWYRAMGLAYDPVPTSTSQNQRARLTRWLPLQIGNPVYDFENPQHVTITVPEGSRVVRLGGRMTGWRGWWQDCHFD